MTFSTTPRRGEKCNKKKQKKNTDPNEGSRITFFFKIYTSFLMGFRLEVANGRWPTGEDGQKDILHSVIYLNT